MSFPGWELDGQDIITCQSDGTWSHQVPSCTPSQCDPLPDIEHGTIVEISDIRRRIDCDTCYRVTNPGAQILKCHEGRWTPPIPTQCEGEGYWRFSLLSRDLYFVFLDKLFVY